MPYIDPSKKKNSSEQGQGSQPAKQGQKLKSAVNQHQIVLLTAVMVRMAADRATNGAIDPDAIFLSRKV